MNREVLTNEELDVLAQAADPTDARALESPPSSSPIADEDDCRRLSEIHEGYAKVLVEIFTKMGQRDVRCRLREAMPGTFGQFVFGQTVPTCCALMRAKPSRGEWLLAVQPSVLYPLIDGLLGVKASEPPPERPMTEIESTVAEWIIREIVESYTQVLQPNSALQLDVERLEHNAQRLRTKPGGERVFLVTYDVQCRADYGRLTLCLPLSDRQSWADAVDVNR